MDTYAAYLALTGGRIAPLVATAGDARNREHVAAMQAAARRSGQARWWTRWKRPVVTVTPAAA
ncbi:MAG TPA: hypothetical protein VK908_11265 [Jiangellales bacterium]|jgi:hypothetical protein|nr:hypothetical protein [Jiangellales bacterium]